MTRKRYPMRALPAHGILSKTPLRLGSLGLVATSGFALLCSACAFVASPPVSLVDPKRTRGCFRDRGRRGPNSRSAIRFINREDTDLPEKSNGESGDASSTQRNASFSSSVFIVDEPDKSNIFGGSKEESGETGASPNSGSLSSSIFIVDEVEKTGVRTTKDTTSEESPSKDQHHTGVFICKDETDTATPSAFTQNIDYLLKYIPIVSPIMAYLTYEKTAQIFDIVIETLADRNWVAVDGGQYQTQIITPAVNGIVVPAISILFATLIANTVSTLRQRQLDIRTTLNTEAGEIRVLQAMVDSFPESAQRATRASGMDSQDRCRAYLIQYTSRLLAESQPEMEVDNLMFTGSMDSELNGLVVELNKVTAACADGSIPPSILSESYGAVTRLNAERSTRISAMQSTYPTLHYVILAVLAASICICFVIESDQQLLIFLNAVQLKILWTMLIGTFSALSVVCYDLGDPFRGYYQITRSLDQLYTIRDALRASDQMKKASRKAKDD